MDIGLAYPSTVCWASITEWDNDPPHRVLCVCVCVCVCVLYGAILQLSS